MSSLFFLLNLVEDNVQMQARSVVLFEQLNNCISCLLTDKKMIENYRKNFDILNDLYYDLQHARVHNRAALESSKVLDKELGIIYEHLMRTLNSLYQKQKMRLMRLSSQIAREELKNPRVSTPKKERLKESFSDTLVLCEMITMTLV